MTKTCFKCQTPKDIGEFYKHPRMADGHLNKCKDCTKLDVSSNYRDKHEYYRTYDAVRQQSPERRIKKSEYAQRANLKAPEKRAARVAVGNALRDGRLTKGPCEQCGTTVGVEAHHDDYSKPLDVRWLCASHHPRELNEAAA